MREGAGCDVCHSHKIIWEVPCVGTARKLAANLSSQGYRSRRIIMKRAITAFVAAGLIATVPLAASTQEAAAVHKQWHKGLATGIGVGVGLGIVGALTRPRQQQVIVQQPAPVYIQPAPQPTYYYSQAHYNYCYSKYRSYDAGTNSYQPYPVGSPRRQCYSPY